MNRFRYLLTLGFIASVLLVSAEDYYWVGGQGIWSDLNSWRTSTGQIPNEVPDAQDNVIFDQNSFLAPFDTVFILTGNPTCNNLTVQNIQDTIVFFGGSSTTTFSIYGSWTGHLKLRNEYVGKIKFQSQQMGNTITCAKSRFPGDLWFEGIGEWILQDTLFVHDSTDWKAIIFGGEDPSQPNPLILHNNGRLDANGQTIICRGLATPGNKPREFDFENAHALMLGNWTLSAENLTFNADNSYILFGGEMNNFNGDDIYYNDIDVMWPDGSIKNTDIRSHHRKCHFLGGGTLDGKKTPGIEGYFTIDTLIMEGAITMTGIIGNVINAHGSDIHYTLFKLTYGTIDGNESFFHRLDDSCIFAPGYIAGRLNVMDSIHYFTPPKGSIIGEATVNHLAEFYNEGVIASEMEKENSANHVVFYADGFMLGNNTISKLSLGSGFWYRVSSDSLNQPGSAPTQTYVQTIGEIEVMGTCEGGVTHFTSYQKESLGYINYTGAGISTEYLAVKDVHNIGSTLAIENGVDRGNNEGFDFTLDLMSRDLYWVDGEGVWSDMEHWSLSSGGPGGECPPTMLDNVFFDLGSGFVDSAMMVVVDVPYACMNDMIWADDIENLPAIQSGDNMKLWGSLKTSESMTWLVFGKVYFESEDDDEYESIIIDWTYEPEPGTFVNLNYFLNQVWFWGRDGKWRLDSKFENYYDTTFLSMGELLLENDTMSMYNFQATDTLRKGMYLLDKTLITLHQYNADAWTFNAYPGLDPTNPNTKFDAGLSTLRFLGDITPPPFNPPGFCHMRTYGSALEYHNVEFSDTLWQGLRMMLKSESQCKYNLVDYYCIGGDAVGSGIIDTLTWKSVDLAAGGTVSADGCKIRNQYFINFLIAESFGDTVMQSQFIDTAIFYEDGAFWGYHNVGYLRAHKFMSLDLINNVDTALFLGNAQFLGRNTFSQMILSPNKKYYFQHETGEEYDTTIIKDDWLVYGDCDAPIRLQSDSIGTQAKILYEANAPTYTDFTAKYTSMRDIKMLGTTMHIAENSVNLGNNTNWEYTSSEGDVYYWVGGQGKWGDWSHWSYESGGQPIDEKCTPKEINTVVFDDNSFSSANDTVIVDVLNAYCMNMYWQHSPNQFKPVFIGADTTSLYVYGSLMLNDSMDYAYSGLIYFDELEEPNVVDTLTSRGHVMLNDIRFQGINDVVVLGDDLELLVDPQAAPPTFTIAFLEHGEFRLDGHELKTGGLYSVFKNERTLDISNSRVTLQYDYDRTWWIDADNLTFKAEQSWIFNESFLGTMWTEGGDYLNFHNVYLMGPLDSLANQGNICEFNVIGIYNEAGLVTGNYVADSILMRGRNAGIFKTSTTNVVIIDSVNGSINNNHTINRCIVNKFGFIRGANDFGYCVFYDDGVFMGKNEFDTLMLYPGAGNFENQGNWFYFQADTSQIVYDSLYMRGNQCSNMNISSLSPPNIAWIVKDDGVADISSDYMNIISVGAKSQNLEFYAGENSSALPDPNNPPPGWIFENAQGYIYGFNGRTERFCLGDPYQINAGDFNGDPSTLYFWEGSPTPGSSTYTITEPGTYQVRVQYFEGCYVDDFVVVEGDQAPIAALPDGPFCEGDEIIVSVSPDHGGYNYQWWNGETTSSIIADTSFTGGIYVAVIDPTNNCKATPNQTILVKPVPRPENYLGDEVWIKFGESITLDAGPGETYEWTASPEVPIDNPTARQITVPGYADPNPVEYIVMVENNDCYGEALKIVGMYPPSKLGVPTAFSPNNDGVNDELIINGSGFAELDFRIYNRYGELVFETTDATVGWDGTVNGEKQEVEVYTYYVRVVYQDKGVVEETGNITLLR